MMLITGMEAGRRRRGGGGKKRGMEEGKQGDGEEGLRAVVVEAGPSRLFSPDSRARSSAKDLKRVGSTPSSRSSAYLSVVPGVHSSHMSAIAEQNEDLQLHIIIIMNT